MTFFTSATLAFLLLAHGADPTPLAWDEALANLVKFAVTFILIAFMSYPVLSPLLKEPEEAQGEQVEKRSASKPNSDTVGWLAVGLLLVLGMGWWLARTSLVEVMTDDNEVKKDHAHTQTEGGQIAMWGDFHAEVVRIESGELRVFLRDSYNRDIAARFFDVGVQPLAPEQTLNDDETPTPGATATPTVASSEPASRGPEEELFRPTKPALNDAYRFCRLSRDVKLYRIKVSTPGWSATLKFDFDGTRGKRSLPIWCATP
jgi:hypothetical protein